MQEQQRVDPRFNPNAGGLCIYLLGPPKISLNNQPIEISRKQVRLLFYYLAACDQFVSYEHLRYLFWPDTVDAVSQRYLGRLLNHLSQCVEIPGLLMRNETHIRLDRRQYWTDLRIFRALTSQPENSNSYENHLEATLLYRGSFLDGVQLNTYQEFENIIENLRTGLEQKYLNTLEAVIKKQAAAGEIQPAIELCQRYLLADDLNENIHRVLMQLYARSGKRKLAIRQFQSCSQILQENLSIKPMLETQDLYQAVLEGRLEQGNFSLTNLPKAAIQPPSLPFLGRFEILEKFNHAVTRASLGEGNVLLIDGAGGKGKTRLLQEFERLVRQQYLCILVNCHAGAGTVPYFPLLKMLRYIQALDPEFFPLEESVFEEAKFISNQINQQTALVPGGRGDSAKVLSYDLWERLTEMFLRLSAQSQPLILLIDDLHQADAATLNWLSYFAEQIEDQPCLLVGSCCCMEINKLGNFHTQLLSMGQACQEYHLEGLLRSVVYQAVKVIFGNVTGCRILADRLHEITAGNPLYLQEILRGIAESGYLPQDLIQKEQWPLPENVWKAVEIRLARLMPLPRKVLENAAYMDSVFDFQQLAYLLELPELELLEAMEDLVCRSILVECHPGYRFQHPLIRLALRRTTSRTRQALIERRLQRMKTHLAAQSASG
jgi:DNA-binding SARP family transcriptional activator